MTDIDVRVGGTLEADLDSEALILPCPASSDSAPWHDLDEQVGGLIASALAGPAFSGKVGRCLHIPLRTTSGPDEIILVGLGEISDLDLETWRRAVASGAAAARRHGARRVAVALRPELGSEEVTAAATAEAVLLGEYRFTEFKKPAPEEVVIGELQILTMSESSEPAVSVAATVARATRWARDLINTAPSDKRPPDFAAVAEKMAAEVGLSCEILDEAAARDLGMMALLAVARGSSVEPRVVVLEHAGADPDAEPVMIVGKGVTFDTGGISLKPATKMDEMKSDMSGAAAALGTMRAVAELDLPLRVVGIVPMAENMPGGDSYRPGDLIRAYGGTTIEVINTDAEGRLILADALAYGCDRFQPRCVVDLATLTGACVVALGEDVAGLMDNDSDLASEIIAAGERVGEPVWRMPMFPHYGKMIESKVADIKNSGARWAGAITAAKFLERFVNDTPWVHLDIAGPAYRTKATPYVPRGGAGFGVRLLVDWLRSRAQA
ncbi:MAG TPA: leucyl aminopeptidase [Acidobacteriota bacterium]|nr:leucyl aminopeptidase [Acidobacteriota bacterium]